MPDYLGTARLVSLKCKNLIGADECDSLCRYKAPPKLGYIQMPPDLRNKFKECQVQALPMSGLGRLWVAAQRERPTVIYLLWMQGQPW